MTFLAITTLNEMDLRGKISDKRLVINSKQIWFYLFLIM